MSSSGPRQILGSHDVAAVAEMAVEPSYISEIARKLQDVGEPWSLMTHNIAVQIVSRAAYAMYEEGRLEVVRPSLGGQVESSVKSTLPGHGFKQSDTWREYTVIRSSTDTDQIRSSFLPYVDMDVSMDNKLEIVQHLSSAGNQMAKISERILQDQIQTYVFDQLELSGYNDPGLDVYAERDGKGYGIEVSTRWVNPISSPYVSSKFDEVAEMEEKRGVPVDLLVMAPRFTNRELRRRRDDDIVALRELPAEGEGNPVIVGDFMEDSSGMGPDYPIVAEGYETLQEDLQNVMREYNVLEETEYRNQIVEIIDGFIR